MAWVVIAGLALADALALPLTGLSLSGQSLMATLAGLAGLLALAWFYTYSRPRPRIAALAAVSAELVAAAALIGLLSYAVVAAHLPLRDSWLVAADRALGLDWLAFDDWVRSRLWLFRVLTLAYFSVVPQLILLQIALNFSGRPELGRELLWTFLLSALACVAVSAAIPAEGAFAFYGRHTDTLYLKTFLALRAGGLGALDLRQLQGVIQFPSFHMMLAVSLAYAARGVRPLFPVVLVLNALVIVATPVIGGHHFADLLGGAVLSVAVIAAVRAMRRHGWGMSARGWASA